MIAATLGGRASRPARGREGAGSRRAPEKELGMATAHERGARRADAAQRRDPGPRSSSCAARPSSTRVATSASSASLEVHRGEFIKFLVGPTGCGKSTFIKALIREVDPAEGEVRIAGRDIGTLKADRIPYLRRRIGTVFQDFKLLPNRTVYDNVAYARSR